MRSKLILIPVFCVLLSFSCGKKDIPVEGIWSGAIESQETASHLPSKITLRGKSQCSILRHRDARLRIKIEGSYSKDEFVLIRSGGETFSIPVDEGRFRHTLELSENHLGSTSWRHLGFSQPDITIEGFQIEETSEYPKMVVLGLDGASWRVLGKLAKAKRVPHFQKLMKNGVYGILESVEDSRSPVIWTTIATGKTPDQHGIVDFLDPDRHPVHSGQVRAKRIWNMLSEHSPLTAGVMGWFVTWPVEPISGFMVSDIAFQNRSMSEDEKKLLYYPPEIRAPFTADSLARTKKYLDETPRFTSFPFDPQYKRHLGQRKPERKTHDLLYKRLFHVYLRDSIYAEAGLHFYEALRPDVFFLYLRGNDYTQHAYWHCLAPDESFLKPSPEELTYFKDVIDNYYIYLDEVLGKYMDAAADNTTFVVVSDHGFRALMEEEDTGRMLSGAHEKQGIYLVSGSGFRENFEHNGISILDVCPLLLYQLGLPVAKDMAGQVPLHLWEDVQKEKMPHFIASYGTNEKRQEGPLSTGADEEILEQLRTLGYIN